MFHVSVILEGKGLAVVCVINSLLKFQMWAVHFLIHSCNISTRPSVEGRVPTSKHKPIGANFPVVPRAFIPVK